MAEDMANNSSVNYTIQARQLASSGCYAKAFDLYITAFEKFPVLKSRMEVEFRLLLQKLNEVLVASNKVSDIFFNFERAHEIYPGNIYLINDIGKYLYKFGYYREACTHFQKALLGNSGYVAAEKNLNSVKNFLVERWHFRMLNDNLRNEAYRKAIHETVKPQKDSVLDLGSGTGILSLYCSECHPISLTAVDSSETMMDIANCVFTDNNVNNVVMVTKLSTALNCLHIEGKKTLLVNEIFDAGLFGEHVLETLVHAWELLVAKVGRILPMKAEFYVAGVKCDYLNLKYQLSSAAKAILNITNLNVHVASMDSYDCEDIHFIKSIEYVTEPSSLVKVDFNDVEDMQNILHRVEPYDVRLKVKKNGEINLIVGWFDLHLSEQVMITTNPLSKTKALAWQQAVFFDYIPTSVVKNDQVPVQFTTLGGKLALTADSALDIKRVSTEMMFFLNDEVYMKMITGCVGAICIYLGQITSMSELDMIDLSPFPVLGLLMMKRGAASLICYAKSKEDKKFIRNVFSLNNIPLSKVTVLVGDELTQDVFTDLHFHLIFCNILDICGDLNDQQKEVAHNLKNSHLVQGGLVLPFSITLETQIVHSNWLEINNRVYDENVSRYKIGQYMNMFQISQHLHIDLSHLEYTPLTDQVTVAQVNVGMRPELFTVPVLNDGDANAILCWYNIELIEKGEILSTNRPSSFINGMAFLANPMIPMRRGNHANILRCVDTDGAFKLVMAIDEH